MFWLIFTFGALAIFMSLQHKRAWAWGFAGIAAALTLYQVLAFNQVITP